MSTDALKWAIEQAPPMPAQLVATLAGLANHADAKGKGAYPSLAKLAAYTCKSERTVRRDLRQLEELKLIRPGDPSKVAHISPDKRPEVYDLAMERKVPGGRAGDDEETRTSARTLASSRERGRAAREAKKARSDAESTQEREDVDVRGDADVRADVDVTSGGTWTSQRADVDVTSGGTWTSAKPSVEPPTNHPKNQEGVQTVTTHLTQVAERDAFGPSPIDVDGFELTDAMRAWSLRTFGPNLDVDYETAQFLDHFRAQNVSRPNWPTEWQKWIRRSAKYASERATRPPLRAVSGDYQPRPSTTDARVQQALDVGRRLQAMHDAKTQENQ
ncbi:helix-turn-helix domain-containing protein [Streptomyces sp. ID05-04B]|uniref:helix-turn-helix domain-containing protein n=1 Tax=Streptomyces sp. ID05-04B TaxID=3028661 RepID=UPI0029C1A238|nr:helix-turn-helix domain-containing protein [Streptomyces sp. ID05-04B]MDX5568460.1 helix-turn-helix domain-containing protein [Streptomyces sp. ID05-04B]